MAGLLRQAAVLSLGGRLAALGLSLEGLPFADLEQVVRQVVEASPSGLFSPPIVPQSPLTRLGDLSLLKRVQGPYFACCCLFVMYIIDPHCGPESRVAGARARFPN